MQLRLVAEQRDLQSKGLVWSWAGQGSSSGLDELGLAEREDRLGAKLTTPLRSQGIVAPKTFLKEVLAAE